MADIDAKKSEGPGFWGWLILGILGFIVAPTDQVLDRIVRPIGDMLREFLGLVHETVMTGVEQARFWLRHYSHTARVWTRRVALLSVLLWVAGMGVCNWADFDQHMLIGRALIALAGVIPGLGLMLLAILALPAVFYVLIAARETGGGLLAAAGRRLGVPELAALQATGDKVDDLKKIAIYAHMRKAIFLAAIIVFGMTAFLVVSPNPWSVLYTVIIWVLIGLAVSASEYRGGDMTWGIKAIQYGALALLPIVLALGFLRGFSKPNYDRLMNVKDWIDNPTLPHLGSLGIIILLLAIPMGVRAIAAFFDEKNAFGKGLRGLSKAAGWGAVILIVLLSVNGRITWSELRGRGGPPASYREGSSSSSSYAGGAHRKTTMATPAPEVAEEAPAPPKEDLSKKDDFELLSIIRGDQ